MCKRFGSVILFAVIITVSASTVYARGWFLQNPYPTSESLSGVKFVNPQKGWIIGKAGLILYTEDGGNTWNIQESGTNRYLTSIFFINEKTGWIVGTGGIILHTQNGGKKWISRDSGSTRHSLHKVFFIDSREGWILGDDRNGEGIILHTRDGGKKWEKQILPDTRLKIASIFFIDNKTGWFLAGNRVFRTEDGGANWEYSSLPIPHSDRSLFRSGGTMRRIGDGWKGDIYFADKKEGWAVVGLWYIFHTDDGGKTWKSQFSGEHMSYGLSHFFFAGPKKGCACGSTFFCTEDGQNWEERLGIKPLGRKSIKSFLIELWAGDFVNNDTGWAVGPYGLIMKTEDGGRNWEVKTRNRPFSFFDNKVGWGVESDTGAILYTDDGARTWKVQTVIKDLEIRATFIFNHLEVSTVWLKTVKDEDILSLHIIHTSDGGKTWVDQPSETILRPQEWPRSLYFVDPNNGWFVGEKGVILHTDDGGRHWKRQKSGTELPLHGVHFIDAKRGWVIGDSGLRGKWIEPDDPQPEGVILHTEDGGQHWHIQWAKGSVGGIVDAVWLNGVFFVDPNKGWITGDNGLLLYTEDGGKTWAEKKIARESLYGPVFIDANRGWMWLLDGQDDFIERTFLITEDGGKTWVKKKTGLHKYPWHPFADNGKIKKQ